MNLVVGATGILGQEICRQLCAAGKPLRALVRASADPAKLEQLSQWGATLVYGDLRNRPSLDLACRGVDAVIVTVSAMPFSYKPGENNIQNVDVQGMYDLVDAAKAAGVHHFVYTSATGNIQLDAPLPNAKRAVERYLRASGMIYTILRPGYFMEVWLSPAVGFDAAHAKATIYGDGTKPLSWIAVPDIARFAVASLDNPAARNAIIELGGPEALTPLQVVEIFERIGGRKFELQFAPAEALTAQWKAATDPMQQSFSAIMLGYAGGDPIDMGKTLKAFPMQMTTVAEYAERTLKAALQPA
ncbi:MAG: SDR family oxidoreductase [Caldilineaceae bacterium]|nr:SDR family oxidoreductase [Caldilineaceae bacterium]